MTIKHTIDSLDTLVRLRTTKVDRLQADLAAQQATQARYKANLERLDGLATGSGASGALPLALALNCGQYKLAVIALADTHRTDLSLHEATMAVSQRALNDAWSERQLLDQVLEQKKGVAALAQHRVERKREDDLATQSWLAGRK
ncbi:flagellar export protein FliJ [Massilia sp. CCM 8695]|uniref:Flagellar export protein FliJ n=1 Tax=Massilia frigida TaxID=2609281 RepID=A0ABX0N322_9BURK|nr:MULTISPECIES: flagellar export protein FliJ [Massilia]MDM5178444.1 flagellar export protein FliJ [Massilia sp. DJPM01]NHZ79452.1 flagellar export protein FliJ [Massilia frigida]